MSIPGRSLQQHEAVARRALLDVESYDVRLDLASDEATFGSVTTIRFTSRGGATFVDLKPTSVRSITLDGHRIDPELLAQGRLPLEADAGLHELVVDAVMPFRNDGEGLHRSVDPADGKHYVYGMSFMDAAPTIFACFDQPDLKAPYTFHVTAPTDWTVIGNAPGTQVEPGVWEMETTPPLSTYFVTIVAGPYHLLRDTHDGIPLGLSARASLAPALDKDADELFSMTRSCFDEFHRLFGIRYPFGDYHQAFVPEFNAGAMENPGCVTFRDNLVFSSRVSRGARIQRATTVAHEMAHQWFGNIVTPQWWDDLWLNESFAEYLGNRVTADVTEYDDAWVHAAYARRQWGLVADQRPTTHPVAGNGAVDAVAALQNFDGISYVKGSTILKQLATSMGDEVFLGGTVDHMERHRFGNATMHDLVASWERAQGGSATSDLGSFVDSWLLTAGPDTITLDRAAGTLRRTPPDGVPTARSHTFDAAVLEAGEWVTTTITLSGDSAALPVGAHQPVVLDPQEQTWAVLVPDATTVEGLKTHLADVTDAAVRAAAWNNLRSGYHQALVDPADVVDVAVASPPVEDHDDTGRHVLPWLLSQVLPLAPAGSTGRLHDAFATSLRTAEPASEVQLAALRGAIRTATSTELLRSWLDASALPPGIGLDLALRWRVLNRLASLGATTPEELDAALAEEPTTVATVEHTRARASLPTAEAKAWAWERFTGAVDVPNYELEAAGVGLWRGGQDEVTRPYVERYFADLPDTPRVRSGWNLAVAAEVFYPLPHADADTLARARTLLADPDALPAAVRKRLLDLADETERRIAIRARFPHDQRG